MHSPRPRAFRLAFSVLAFAACSDPNCPPDSVRVGKQCKRPSFDDAGVDDAGERPTDDGGKRDAEGDAGACMKNVCGGCAVIETPERLGKACTSGLGDCAAPGAWVCDGKDALTCSGEAAAAGAETCGGGDEDCDGQVDESSVSDPAEGSTTWYADCDGDGFAPKGATSVRTCAKPTADDTGCNTASAAWTDVSPQANDDCSDGDARAFPGQTSYFTEPRTGTAANFDFDCDGEESPSFDFEELSTKTGSGCDSHPIDWILAVDASNCFDHTTGYAAACGREFAAPSAGFASDESRIECGETGTVCKWAYNVTLPCR